MSLRRGLRGRRDPREAPPAEALAHVAGGGLGRIGEGPQHPGHIAQRRALAAALLRRARRLALEIDDHDVVLDDQHLAKMIIAVDARLDRLRRAPGRGCSIGAQHSSLRASRSCKTPARRPTPPERSIAAKARSACALASSCHGGEIDGRKRLGPEGLVVGGRREGQVEFRRSLAQHPDDRQVIRQSALEADGVLLGHEGHGVELALEGLGGPAPGIALIADEALQNGDRRRRAVFADMLHDGRGAAGVLEAGDLGQEAADLDFGMLARLEAAIELEDHVLAHGDRRVALLAPRGA